MVMRLAKTAAAPTAKNGFLFTILGSKWGILWLWLLVINVLALLAYGLDKLLARKQTRRVPERTLLLIAAIGGSLGSLLGMLVAHHKTRKAKFYILVPLLLVLHAAAAGWYFLR